MWTCAADSRPGTFRPLPHVELDAVPLTQIVESLAIHRTPMKKYSFPVSSLMNPNPLSTRHVQNVPVNLASHCSRTQHFTSPPPNLRQPGKLTHRSLDLRPPCRLLLRRSLFDGCAPPHERRRHVDPAGTRMFLGDVRGEAIGRHPLPAEPAEGLARRDVDALHSDQHEWLSVRTSSANGSSRSGCQVVTFFPSE